MRVESEPPGARVIVDGEEVGVTPVDVREPILGANPHAGVEIIDGTDHMRLGVTRKYRIDAGQVALAGGLAALGVSMVVVPLLWLEGSFGEVDETTTLVLAPIVAFGVPLLAYLLPFSCAPLVMGEPEGPDVLHVDMVRRRVTATPESEVVIHRDDNPPPMLH